MSDTTETSTDATTETEAATTETAADTADAKDWAAEAAKWKAMSRKHEDTAKANADKAKRLDEIEEASASELDKVTKTATQAQADAAAAKAELAIVKAAVKHGLSEDDLDLLGSHGTAEEIDARAEKLAGRLKAAADSKPKPDFGGGDRGDDVAGKGKQITSKGDLDSMTPTEINQARREGRLDGLLHK